MHSNCSRGFLRLFQVVTIRSRLPTAESKLVMPHGCKEMASAGVMSPPEIGTPGLHVLHPAEKPLIKTTATGSMFPQKIPMFRSVLAQFGRFGWLEIFGWELIQRPLCRAGFSRGTFMGEQFRFTSLLRGTFAFAQELQ